MTTRRKLLCLLVANSVMPGIANAGAWSHESFANDGALDWIAEFAADPNAKFLNETFAQGTQNKYIENYAGESIIAAAEVVASSLGQPSPDLPKELKPLIEQRRKEFSAQAVAARNAVKGVLGPKSELREIWAERAEGLIRWQGSVECLLKRLQ